MGINTRTTLAKNIVELILQISAKHSFLSHIRPAFLGAPINSQGLTHRKSESEPEKQARRSERAVKRV